MVASKMRFISIQSNESGSSLVELALSLSVLMTIIFGIIDCSRALYTDHYVTNVARDAARYAMVRGSSWGVSCATASSYDCTATSANITSYVQSITPLGINTSSPPLTVTTSWPGKTPAGGACDNLQGNKSPTCMVRVKVNYSFNFFLPFLPKNAVVLTSTAAVAIAQ